jgi:hypothetical protein
VVSDKTLLTLLPFIDDADAEMEKIEEQKQKNMAMYNFGNEATEDDEE